MNLAPYIRELITLNECIILPDFGGFETTYISAEYDAKKNRMLPPSKKVWFKSEYTKGGQILEQHLVKKLNISDEEARREITSYVKEIRDCLNAQNKFEVDDVGLFQLDDNNAIKFSPFEEENYLAESFGLESLPYQKVESEYKAKSVHRKVLELKPRNNTLTIVIFGVVLVCMLLGLTVFVSARFNLYLFNIGDSSNQDELIVIGGNKISDPAVKQIEDKIDEFTSVKNALQFSEHEAPGVSSSPSTSYILVAGSFKGFHNARELQNKLVKDGFKVDIVEARGYYRVSIGKFTIKKEALKELQRIRTQINRSVWLLTISES